MSASKRHLDYLSPVFQWGRRQLLAVPFLVAGLVLLGGIGGFRGTAVAADWPAVELDAGAVRIVGGDFQLAEQGGPVPAAFDNSVYHFRPSFYGALCAVFLIMEWGGRGFSVIL